LRHQLQGSLDLSWVDSAPDVVHFERPGGWQSITNVGQESVALPSGNVVLSSDPVIDEQLPPDTTAWITRRS